MGIQPAKEGFDSLEASVARGIRLSDAGGTSGPSRAQRTLEPILRLGGRQDALASQTILQGIEDVKLALKVMRNKVV